VKLREGGWGAIALSSQPTILDHYSTTRSLTMLMLVDHTFKVIKTCKNDQEFCHYICYLKNQENQKAASNPETTAFAWEFMRCPHKFLKAFFNTIDQGNFREIAEQAYAAQQDMLMIYKGEESPLFLPAPPEAGIDQLKQNWAKTYAKEHGLHVITV
jgi:hypothetical protein